MVRYNGCGPERGGRFDFGEDRQLGVLTELTRCNVSGSVPCSRSAAPQHSRAKAKTRRFRSSRCFATSRALREAHDVGLSGDLAFVSGKGGNIAIIDVGKPEKPQLLWFQHDPQRLFDAETVLLAPNRLFLGTCDFISIDVTDPRKPVFQTWLSSRPRISRINGMVRRGNFILAANKDGWIDALDVSDAELPCLAAALEVRKRYDMLHPHDIDLCGPHAVVADAHNFGKTAYRARWLCCASSTKVTSYCRRRNGDWSANSVATN